MTRWGWGVLAVVWMAGAGMLFSMTGQPRWKTFSEKTPLFSPVWKHLDDSPSEGPVHAPLTLVEFSDFQCPFCAQASPVVSRLMREYPGKIRRIWKHFPLGMHPKAMAVHEASLCAHEQGVFWKFHDQAFSRQPHIAEQDGLDAIAEELKLDSARFKACRESGRYKTRIQEDQAEGKHYGVDGTPAFFLNGIFISGVQPYDYFKKLAEALLHPNAKPSFVVTAQPLEPILPDKVEFQDLEGRPFSGPADAPVTLVEFSDFHCPFCRKHAETLKALREKFPQQIRILWRHFPLSIHAAARDSHIAAECAHEQGKFWVYHDQLFQHQEDLSKPETRVRLAEAAGLDLQALAVCTASGRAAAAVDQDLAAGRKAGVNGTPATFLNGLLEVGALPQEKWEARIQQLLEQAKVPS